MLVTLYMAASLLLLSLPGFVDYDEIQSFR